MGKKLVRANGRPVFKHIKSEEAVEICCWPSYDHSAHTWWIGDGTLAGETTIICPGYRYQRDPTLMYCSVLNCKETFPNHAWGSIKLKGWFRQWNGDNWCPKHVPDWVDIWRMTLLAKDPDGS